MGYVALDLSKSSTGWCAWIQGWEKPRYGCWVLGSEYSSRGQVFAKLHQNLSELHQVICPIEYLFAEEPISPAQLQGGTNLNSLRIQSGLSAHVESWAHAMRDHGCRPLQEFNISSWRPAFIGRIADSEAKAKARRQKKAGNLKASARDTLKELTMQRCRQLGMNPRKNDEADSIGILTHALLVNGITPPWLASETLQTPLEIPA